MAQILFGSQAAFQRFTKMKSATADLGNNSLESCIQRLMSWNPWNARIIISCDAFDDLSFSFHEDLPVDDMTSPNPAQTRTGICGGIILHGKRDAYGSGQAPTFSVTLEKTEGYSIHT